MTSKYHLLIGLLLFNFFLFPMISLTITMPNVTNPMCDLLQVVGCAQTPTGASAGTTQGVSGGGTVSPQQQSSQSCIAGGLVGAAVGAAAVVGIGILTGGIGAIPAAALVFGGGLGGCTISSTLFSSAGSTIFTNLVNNAGPFGAFLQALSVAMAWVGPVLQFFGDSVTYELTLLASAPEIGIFLFPLQAVTAIFFMFLAAEYIRGSGMMG